MNFLNSFSVQMSIYSDKFRKVYIHFLPECIFNSIGRKKRLKLISRIDIAREAYLNNPSEFRIEALLGKLQRDVTEVIFNFESRVFKKLTVEDHDVICFYLKTLIEIYRASIKLNRAVLFSSQRDMFEIFGYLLNSPYAKNYSQNFDQKNDVVFSSYFYEIVELQNKKPNPAGNLCAQAEWLNNLSSLYFSIYRITPSQSLLESTLSLLKWTYLSAANNRPEVLIDIFENLRDQCTTSFPEEIYVNPLETLPWWSQWETEFKELQYSIFNIDDFSQAIGVLKGLKDQGNWAKYEKYISEPLPEIHTNYSQIECIKACIHQSAMAELFFMFCTISGKRQWEVLYQIWYCSSPKDSTVNYCDNDFFTRNPSALLSWFIRCYEFHSLDFHSFDRNPTKVNAVKFLLVLFSDYVNENEEFIFNMPSNDVIEVKTYRHIVSEMILFIKLIENPDVIKAFEWREFGPVSLKDKCLISLNRMRDSADKKINDILSSQKPNRGKNDLAILYSAWEQTGSNCLSDLSTCEWLVIKYSKKLQSKFISQKFYSHKSYFFSADSSERISGVSFYTGNILNNFSLDVISEIKSNAGGERGEKSQGTTWFVPESRFPRFSQAKTQLSNELGFTIQQDEYIHIYPGDCIFSIEQGAFECLLYDWGNLPWGSSESAKPVYGFVNFAEKAEGELHLYYSVQILDQKKITIF